VQSSLQPLPSASNNSSFSDYASEASSAEYRSKAAQYETPPSRAHSPIALKPAESEMTLPARPMAVHPAPLNIRSSQAPQPPQIPTSDLYRDIHDMSPPTPGLDESPYIRFAIEQLTRDEETLGRARHGSMSSLDYPVERIVPDEGLGYYTAPATRKRASAPPAARRLRSPPRDIERRGMKTSQRCQSIANDLQPLTMSLYPSIHFSISNMLHSATYRQSSEQHFSSFSFRYACS